MGLRKKVMVFAAIFCGFLCLPLAHSRADKSLPFLRNPQKESAYCASGEDDENGVNTEPLVALQDGDTVVFDNLDQEIGTLRVNSEDGTVQYFEKTSKTWKKAKVLYGAPADLSGQWKRRSVGKNITSRWLLYVSVWVCDVNYAIKHSGWVNAGNVLNFEEISENLNNAPLLRQIESLQKELEIAKKTPVPIPTPKETLAPDDVQPAVREKDPQVMVIVIAGIFIILAFMIMGAYFNQKRVRSGVVRGKHDKSAWPEESSIPEENEAGDSIEKNEEASGSESQGRLRIPLERIHGRKLRNTPAPKDWEELAAIAKSAMSEPSFESWKNAFRAKNWIPLGIQPTALNIPGDYEIAAFGMSQSLALFASHDPAEKGHYYVIPSISDRDLRSNQLPELFDFREGELENDEPYRIVKPAVLNTLNDRFFKKLFPGEILIPLRK